MLFISHDLSAIAHMCRNVAVMYLGRIVEIAPRDVLFKSPLHPYTAALISATPLPDPPRERSRRRILLKGEPPSPTAAPTGRRFRTRCPCATGVGPKVDSELRLSFNTHLTACHYPLTQEPTE